MRTALWRSLWRERMADLCQTVSHRLDPARPVVVRAEEDRSGNDWEIWVSGLRALRIPGEEMLLRGPSTEFKPRWRS